MINKLKIILFFIIIFFSFPKTGFAAVSFSTTTGGLGNIITATSNNEFGSVKGEIIFFGTDIQDINHPYREEKADIFSWTENNIVFQVPLRIPLTWKDQAGNPVNKYFFKIKKADNSIISDNNIYNLSNFMNLSPTAPSRIVLNPNQGLGMCHSLDIYLKNINYLSWAYPGVGNIPWNQIQPDNTDMNYFKWTIIDNYLETVRLYNEQTGQNKKIWLQVGTTEGAIPDWAAYKDPNGSRDPSYNNPNIKIPVAGTRCASRNVKESCNNPNQLHMACDASCSLDEKIHAKGTPIPWNEEYQRLLRNLIYKMAERYDGHPNIEAILVMGGGCYGELTICESRQTSTDPNPAQIITDWRNLGYTNQRYVDAVKKIIDIYLEDENSSPTHTAGFQETPVVIQLGMGLYTDGSQFVSGKVADYTDETYGLRVWLKQNGLDNIGGNGDYYWYYKRHVGNTRVSYERGFWQRDCNSLKGYQEAALNDNSSHLCGSHDDLSALVNCPDATLFAKYGGSHIILSNPSFTKDNDDNFTFSGSWKNLGNFPLTAQKRVDIKDEKDSYKLVFYFINPSSNLIISRISLYPSIPTTNWFGYKIEGTNNLGPNIFSTSNSFDAKINVPNGTYLVKMALENEGRGNQRFRLVESGGLTEDTDSKYTLGTFTISRSSAPSPTPTYVCTNKTSGFTKQDFLNWKSEFITPRTPLQSNFNCSQKTDLADFEVFRKSFTSL